MSPTVWWNNEPREMGMSPLELPESAMGVSGEEGWKLQGEVEWGREEGVVGGGREERNMAGRREEGEEKWEGEGGFWEESKVEEETEMDAWRNIAVRMRWMSFRDPEIFNEVVEWRWRVGDAWGW